MNEQENEFSGLVGFVFNVAVALISALFLFAPKDKHPFSFSINSFEQLRFDPFLLIRSAIRLVMIDTRDLVHSYRSEPSFHADVLLCP